jgi:hypothetical protein
VHVLSWLVCTFRGVTDVHSQGHSEVFEAMGLTFSQDMITREYEHILKRGENEIIMMNTPVVETRRVAGEQLYCIVI